MHTIRRLILAILPALALQTSWAPAQQIQLDEFPPPANAPDAPPRPQPGLPGKDVIRQWPTPPTADSPMPGEEAQASDVLLPLRARSPRNGGPDGHRLQGEYPAEGFWLFLPKQIDGVMLDISTLSSINLLPERSHATVKVNGTEIGEIRLANFSATGTASLAVPDGLLRAGRNLVELHLQQVHRVLCGPEASFGLWTDIIAHESGISVPRSDLGPDPLGFMAAIAAQLGQGSIFELANANSLEVLDAAPSVAKIESLFGGLPPKITVDDYYSVATPGGSLARVTVLPEQYAMPDLPAFRSGGDGAIVLLTDSGEAEKIATLLTGALGDMMSEPPLPEATPGAPQTLSDLGVGVLEGRGHYIDKSVSFRLPWDWLGLASQDAGLRLDYAFADDLPSGSLLLVKLNGETVRLLPLDDPAQAGRRLDPLQIPFDANLLQPGVNELSFEALVPGAPVDAACAPRSEPVFRVFETSRLDIPNSPSMTLPRIDRTLASADISQISMSEAAQRSLPIGLLPQIASIFAPDESSAAAQAGLPRDGSIRVGIPADLSSIPGDIVSKNVSMLEEVLLSTPAALEETADPWATVDQQAWWRVFVDRREAASRLRELKGKIASLWRGPESDLDSWLADRSAMAMLIQPDMEAPEDLWLIVRPNTDYDRLVASLVDMHDRPGGPRGQVSMFGFDGKWQVWVSANRPLSLLEPLSPRNARAVVGNYVTLSPGRYIVPLFLLAIGCALSAMGLLIVGRRRKT